MDENKNTTTPAAAEEAINSIKKLLDAVGNDEELKRKLEDALAALTGKQSEPRDDAADEKDPETESVSASDPDSADEEEKDDEEEDTSVVSSSDLSDIFTEDAIAGLAIGFIAGAAVVGGGVLLHKLIAND